MIGIADTAPRPYPLDTAQSEAACAGRLFGSSIY